VKHFEETFAVELETRTDVGVDLRARRVLEEPLFFPFEVAFLAVR
jgi:hypothetical protein